MIHFLETQLDQVIFHTVYFGPYVAAAFVYRSLSRRFGTGRARVWLCAIGLLFAVLFACAGEEMMRLSGRHAWTAAVIAPFWIMLLSWPIFLVAWLAGELALRRRAKAPAA